MDSCLSTCNLIYGEACFGVLTKEKEMIEFITDTCDTGERIAMRMNVQIHKIVGGRIAKFAKQPFFAKRCYPARKRENQENNNLLLSLNCCCLHSLRLFGAFMFKNLFKPGASSISKQKDTKVYLTTIQ